MADTIFKFYKAKIKSNSASASRKGNKLTIKVEFELELDCDDSKSNPKDEFQYRRLPNLADSQQRAIKIKTNLKSFEPYLHPLVDGSIYNSNLKMVVEVDTEEPKKPQDGPLP